MYVIWDTEVWEGKLQSSPRAQHFRHWTYLYKTKYKITLNYMCYFTKRIISIVHIFSYIVIYMVIHIFICLIDETRILGRTLGHVRRILYAILRVPCDFRAHWTVHITRRAESFTLSVCNNNNNNNNTQWKVMTLHNRHPRDLSRL